MEPIGIEEIVRDWLHHAITNPRTGVPPDAKVAIDVRKLPAYGPLDPGDSEPTFSVDVWTTMVTLFFPAVGNGPDLHAPDVAEIKDAVERLRDSVERDPSFGDQVLRAEWRGVDKPRLRRYAPSAYPWAVDLWITLTGA